MKLLKSHVDSVEESAHVVLNAESLIWSAGEVLVVQGLTQSLLQTLRADQPRWRLDKKKAPARFKKPGKPEQRKHVLARVCFKCHGIWNHHWKHSEGNLNNVQIYTSHEFYVPSNQTIKINFSFGIQLGKVIPPSNGK